jgi:hypothetical protein
LIVSILFFFENIFQFQLKFQFEIEMEKLHLPYFILSPFSKVLRLCNNLFYQRQDSSNMTITCPYCRKVHHVVKLIEELIRDECGICWETKSCKLFSCSTIENRHSFCLTCLQQIDQSQLNLLELVTATRVPVTIYRDSIRYFDSKTFGYNRLIDPLIDPLIDTVRENLIKPNQFTIVVSNSYIWLFVYRHSSKNNNSLTPDFYRFDMQNQQHLILLTKKINRLKRYSKFIITDQNIIPSIILPKQINRYIINSFTEKLKRNKQPLEQLQQHLDKFEKLYFIRSEDLQYQTRMMNKENSRPTVYHSHVIIESDLIISRNDSGIVNPDSQHRTNLSYY